ncbi:DNA topoisomerase IB [Silicimonas algicola]|uniref:DNA topoisomerase n=2 Tax=Silicimonas algicola TaxID=1826607 RepID=A0A316G4L0_9RHOB|nr:DNA topoisomerase IB [Silicimonas algicola]AZQ69527.1 DNA topoisomerase IB [Silicimonas algicola]PWK54856.1 DNA topoisomerase-1 [Silicimonas algicola]
MNAAPASLTYYPDNRPGIRRERKGRGFSYIAPDGTRISRGAERQRIESLAVPPAYENVWICPKPNGHLQATGYDVRERKQYRYHPDWTTFRSERKFERLADFGRCLPGIRRRVSKHLNLDAGEQGFAIAAVVAMMDCLSLRVGNPEYADENGTYGATTLKSKHLRLQDHALHLNYVAKGNKKVMRQVGNRKLMETLQKLHDLPGAELVTWIDEDGDARAVSSDQVNAWIQEATGQPDLTAKTFRTWAGSVAALEAAAKADRVTIKGMSEAAAERLANTPTIARTSYIHPAVIALAETPEALQVEAEDLRGLRASERKLLGLLDYWKG